MFKILINTSNNTSQDPLIFNLVLINYQLTSKQNTFLVIFKGLNSDMESEPKTNTVD